MEMIEIYEAVHTELIAHGFSTILEGGGAGVPFLTIAVDDTTVQFGAANGEWAGTVTLDEGNGDSSGDGIDTGIAWEPQIAAEDLPNYAWRVAEAFTSKITAAVKSAKIDAAIAEAGRAQGEMWDCLRKIEDLLGFDFDYDCNNSIEDHDLTSFVEYAEAHRDNDEPDFPVAGCTGFNPRETATILHALRKLQDPANCNYICEHFDDAPRLTNEEIDELCERINCAPLTKTLTLWTLAWDTDCGTGAEVYTDERSALEAMVEMAGPDDDDVKNDACKLIGEEGFWDFFNTKVRKDLDTYIVESHTVEIP